MKISKDAIIGLVVIISIGILIWGINFLKGLDVFTQDYNYYARYERIDGLKKSSPVTLKGFKIGQINNIQFEPGNLNHLIISFSVDQEYNFPKNSSARIVSSNIMGTKEIKIIPGTSQSHLHPGDTIPGSIEGDLKEQVSMQMLPLKNKAERLMSSLDSVLAVIQYVFDENTRDNLSKSFASIKNTIQYLENTSQNLDTLMTTQKGKMANIFTNIDSITLNLKNHNKHIGNILRNFSSISDTLSQAELGESIKKAHSTLNQASLILTKINNGKGSIGALINNDTLYTNLEEASQNLNILLADLKENPKRYVNFSLVDFGASKQNSKKELSRHKYYYTIHILSSKKPISLKDKRFKDFDKIREIHSGNKYQYTIGQSQSHRKISKLLQRIRKEFPDAYLIKITWGK